ncbi:MAG: hypothetical protein ACJZ1R_04075 [Candidatus Neomarinimicrobiota bacterium]
MIPLKLNYNYSDIFRAPRLALSGKKILFLIKGNLFGYIAYFIFSLISLLSTGMSTQEIISKYGLYPCLFGHQAEWFSWLVYFFGISIWFFALMLSLTGVCRIFLKQLKGNDFFSGKDASKFVFKHRHALVLTPITIFLIIIFFLLLASIFALIGKIPVIGNLTLSILYILYFLGSVFTILSTFVLFTSLIYTPSIVGLYEEDTMGSVFQIYSITFSQPWRILFYNIILAILIFIGIEIYSWVCLNSIGLISYIFGHNVFMGDQFSVIHNHSLSVVFPNIIVDTFVHYKTLILEKINLNSGIPLLFSPSTNLAGLNDLSVIETISSILLSIAYFTIALSVFSYGLAMLAVGQSLMFVTFKKLSDDDDLIFRADEDDDTDDLKLQNTFESVPRLLPQDNLYEEE